jgi:Uma2 family endonuclease
MTILLAEEVKQVVSEELPAWIEKQPDLRLRLRQAIGKIPGEPLSKQHQLTVGFLEKVLGTFVEQHNLGVVLSAPFQNLGLMDAMDF